MRGTQFTATLFHSIRIEMLGKNKKKPAWIEFIENKEKLMEICDAALNFFAENAKPSERFKFTIDRVGREKFEQRILEVYNG